MQKKHILKGIIARGETLAMIGPPGSGKSALMTEISVHCAAQIDWRGHRAKGACGVVIFALERADLFKRRLKAYQQRDGLHGLPIAVADAVIDLLNPNCVEIIVSTVLEAERQFGCGVGLIVIDTYAKGIAANGGDEDKAKDQNRAAANLRNVHSRLAVHIALVGHIGKDESRGARGSNAHLGDVDVMVQISGDTIKVAQVIKGNDQPERMLAEFKLEPFELGRDEDGDLLPPPLSRPNISSRSPPVRRQKGRSFGNSEGRTACPKRGIGRRRPAPQRHIRAHPKGRHMRHIGRVARSAHQTRHHQPKRQPPRTIQAHSCDAPKRNGHRHLGGLCVARHIASQPVTVTARDTGITPSRHIRPPIRGGVHVTGAQQCREGRIDLIRPASDLASKPPRLSIDARTPRSLAERVRDSFAEIGRYSGPPNIRTNPRPSNRVCTKPIFPCASRFSSSGEWSTS